MKKLYLSNAFSLQMLELKEVTHLRVTPLDLEEAQTLLSRTPFESAVGHFDTASVFTEQLGFFIPVNRVNLKINPGDSIVVGQLIGGRLPEGALFLPENFKIQWVLVNII